MADVRSPSRMPLAAVWRKQIESFERQQETQHRSAIERLQLQQEADPRNAATYIQIAHHHQQMGEHKLALRTLKNGLSISSPSAKLYRYAVNSLAESNQTKEAIETARLAANLFPADALFFKLQEKLLLPVIYDTEAEIVYYQRRFLEGITELRATSNANKKLAASEYKHRALRAIDAHSNFYLPYCGRDILPLQSAYSEFARGILSENYPQWLKPRTIPSIPEGGKIRVGYISPHFGQHSDAKCFLGWLRERNRDDFEVFAFQAGADTAYFNDDVRRACDHFSQTSPDLQRLCEAIHQADLHVSVLLDHEPPMMTQLACLRLAPIQCATWGRPVTSGSPAIDYYLSSALVEPEDGQQHYVERLHLLPGIGICFYKPVIPRPLLDLPRSSFGLGNDRTVYLCCQSVFKYLPQQDGVFLDIAKRNPNAQFVFLTPNQACRDDLRRRLERAFTAGKLDAADHCVWLPRPLNRFDYWNLHLISDVYLDTFEFSGGVTTLEAIACGLPVVTLPGRFHRGRHSCAILRQLGVTATIANSHEEYVNIAVRLGQDRDWRTEIIREMTSRHDSLFADVRPVIALEGFFRQIVTEAAAKQSVAKYRTHV